MGFPEVGLVLQRHKEGTLMIPLSLRPPPPMLMYFTDIFLARHADSQLLHGVVHVFMHKLLLSTDCILPTSQALHHIQSPPVTHEGKISGVKYLTQWMTWAILLTTEG